ncbi:MAG: hypothetical protein EOP45_22895 [Sphingobacteriaceae bacterium]|nr:MAG: hypothetical protein EOP45_22895 [Sphingobacteriaceae bacterium]
MKENTDGCTVLNQVLRLDYFESGSTRKRVLSLVTVHRHSHNLSVDVMCSRRGSSEKISYYKKAEIMVKKVSGLKDLKLNESFESGLKWIELFKAFLEHAFTHCRHSLEKFTIELYFNKVVSKIELLIFFEFLLKNLYLRNLNLKKVYIYLIRYKDAIFEDLQDMYIKIFKHRKVAIKFIVES